ncbi:MAG: hypothetical protein AAGM22_05770 [Acidobacteriota bacterium]
MLPQKFPFAFLDREGDENGVPVQLAATGRVGRGRPLAQGLALEILAQAALVQLVRPAGPDGAQPGGAGGGETKKQPAIGGFDDVHYAEAWARHPPLPGETLRAQTELLGRFGPMLKVKARLYRDEAEIVSATLLLVSG